jgi:hypothetical protein
LKVLKTGTILDSAPVEKVQVFQGSKFDICRTPCSGDLVRRLICMCVSL